MPGDPVLTGRRRDPSDVVDSGSGKVRVLSRRCSTCVFRTEGRELFGPAVCAGFWARHGMETAAGRIAKHLLGIVRVVPPGSTR
jgi:hypothetical protein